jgi:hypothetical protein
MTNPLVYAVKEDGTLLWHSHGGQADGTDNWQGPKEVASGWNRFSNVFSGGDGVIYANEEASRDPRTGGRTGGLLWYRHDGRGDGTSNWQGPKTIGNTWSDFSTVFSGGDGVIYAVQEESRDPRTGGRIGGLLWYRHDGQSDGTSNWQGPKIIGHGWSGFTKLFSGGDGVIYAIRDNGELLWYRHDGRASGSFRWAEGSGKVVGSGWNRFSTVFSGGDGVIYAVEEASRNPRTGERTGGHLLWYRHDHRSDGTSSWQGPNIVRNGWSDFSTVFSGGAALGLVDSLDDGFCGVPEQGGRIGPLTFGSPGGRWTRGALNVSINVAGATFVNATPAAPNAGAVIAAAFAQWQTPPNTFPPSFFTFTFVPPGTGEDIRVIFGGSGVDPSFGRPGGVLASAGYPELGNLQFDSSEVWNPNSLLSVALHEIGHLLGLSHSNVPAGTMNPFANSALAIDAESRIAIAAMYGWQPQQRASDGGTSHRPSLGVTSITNLAATLQTAYMVWKGVEDSGIYFSEFRGAWSPQERIIGVGCSCSPALTQIAIPGSPTPATGLLMAWKGVSDDQTIYWTRDMGFGWEAQRPGPDAGTSAGPALANVNGRIYMAWKGAEDDSGIYWSTYDGAESWSPQANVRGVGTSDSPALVAFNGMLYMFWKGVSGDANAYYSFFDFANDPIWKPQKRVEYFSYETGGGVPHAIGTSGALSAAVRGNSIILTWKGVEDDSTIYFSLFANNEFSGQAGVPNVGTSVGPSVVQVGGNTLMAWKGIEGDSAMYWSRL